MSEKPALCLPDPENKMMVAVRYYETEFASALDPDLSDEEFVICCKAIRDIVKAENARNS